MAGLQLAARLDASEYRQDFRRGEFVDWPRAQMRYDQVVEHPFGLAPGLGRERLAPQPFPGQGLEGDALLIPGLGSDIGRVLAGLELLAGGIATFARLFETGRRVAAQTDHPLASVVAVPEAPQPAAVGVHE